MIEAVATMPAVCPPTFISLRRVIVSPSNAPGMPRSIVYFDLCLSCLSDTGTHNIEARISASSRRRARLCA